MRLFNTLTNKKEEFKPLRDGEVSIYVCGPTVYNYVHIGNTRPMIVFDVLRRTFEYLGYKVTFVSNFTDVDDKIIKAAKQEGISEKELTDKYIKAYEDVRRDLNLLFPTYAPRVTNTMEAIISFIDDLVKTGYAYEVDGDVYFRVSKIEEYGQLSGIKIEDLVAGASERVDLKFPHHENEIAQSMACHHHPIAHTWMHNQMINIDNQKMSKSLGNVIWAKDMINDLGCNVYKWFMLSSHYRNPLNLTDAVLNNVKKEVAKVDNVVKTVSLYLQVNGLDGNEYCKETVDVMVDALEDDLNTSLALTQILNQVKVLNQLMRVKEKDDESILMNYNTLMKMVTVMGFVYQPHQLSLDELELYKKWLEAKEVKNFDIADKLRSELISKGIL